MYETTDLRQAIECKVLVSPARAYARATPAQRRGGSRTVPRPARPLPRPAAAPAPPGTPPRPGRPRQGHPGRHGRPDRRLRPPVRPDGRVPCFHCAVCDAAFARCAKALAPAEARLHAGQAVDADRVRTSATVAELEMLVVELRAGSAERAGRQRHPASCSRRRAGERSQEALQPVELAAAGHDDRPRGSPLPPGAVWRHQ